MGNNQEADGEASTVRCLRVQLRGNSLLCRAKMESCFLIPSRCSSAFFVEERTALRQKRQKMRLLQQGKISDVSNCKDLPDEIPLRLNIGTKVTGNEACTFNNDVNGFYCYINVTVLFCILFQSSSPWRPRWVVHWADWCSGHHCSHVPCYFWQEWTGNTHCAWLRSSGNITASLYLKQGCMNNNTHTVTFCGLVQIQIDLYFNLWLLEACLLSICVTILVSILLSLVNLMLLFSCQHEVKNTNQVAPD